MGRPVEEILMFKDTLHSLDIDKAGWQIGDNFFKITICAAYIQTTDVSPHLVLATADR